jgi:tRNA threonylcarbamoyl adenosine modification protein YeaZ
MLLAIDTSTRYAGVALLNGDGELVRLAHWRSKQNHSVELLSTIQSLLQSEQVRMKALAGIAVALGPGSFSALRVGLSVAKGLAWASSLPLVSATTLETEAFLYRHTGKTICAVLDAGRDQVASALFWANDGTISKVREEDINTPRDTLFSLPSPTLVCGEALEKFGATMSEATPEGVTLALPYLPGQRVVSLAYLGWARLNAGVTQDPASLQPLYLRRPTITEPKRPDAQRPDARR